MYTIIIDCDTVELAKEYINQASNGYAGDYGFNILFPDDFHIHPHEVKLIDLHVKIHYVKKNVRIPYMLVPRSSIYKVSIMMANSVGIIDKGYDGNLKVAIREMNGQDLTLPKHTSLFQTIMFNGKHISNIIIKVNGAEIQRIINIDTFKRLTRGDNGFGSTNKE